MKTIHFLALLVLIVLAGCQRVDGTDMTFGDYFIWTLAAVTVVLFAIGAKRSLP